MGAALMAGIVYPIRLQSIDALITVAHGRPRSLTAAETATLRDYADLIIEDIQDRWPVDTGTSRDGWTYELYNHPPGIGFDLINEVEYSPYVSAAGDRGQPAYEILIPWAVGRHAPDLRAELTRQINAEEQRRRDREARAVRLPPPPGTLRLRVRR